MKRALGAMAANWLRKPENQERIKRTARDVWGKFQQRRESRRHWAGLGHRADCAATSGLRSDDA